MAKKRRNPSAAAEKKKKQESVKDKINKKILGLQNLTSNKSDKDGQISDDEEIIHKDPKPSTSTIRKDDDTETNHTARSNGNKNNKKLVDDNNSEDDEIFYKDPKPSTSQIRNETNHKAKSKANKNNKKLVNKDDNNSEDDEIFYKDPKPSTSQIRDDDDLETNQTAKSKANKNNKKLVNKDDNNSEDDEIFYQDPKPSTSQIRNETNHKAKSKANKNNKKLVNKDDNNSEDDEIFYKDPKPSTSQIRDADKKRFHQDIDDEISDDDSVDDPYVPEMSQLNRKVISKKGKTQSNKEYESSEDEEIDEGMGKDSELEEIITSDDHVSKPINSNILKGGNLDLVDGQNGNSTSSSHTKLPFPIMTRENLEYLKQLVIWGEAYLSGNATSDSSKTSEICLSGMDFNEIPYEITNSFREFHRKCTSDN
ncbi:putative uncharacterized protein DDB_G0287457 [Leptopilina boulardi]|uniref:putative uncharacterized protein DDB_G0287457 n=1 Tax=Leptopilina boulardi TaxID=63433 RepID=UPI0021F5623A|nr:putative uncharacterized protein DDB_G0287457 [Leptopilina boulardi]